MCTLQTDSKTATSEPQPKITDKFVLLLALDSQSTFKNIFAQHLAALECRIVVMIASEAEEAFEFLASPDLYGVYVVDAGIAESENAAVVSALAEYVRSGGQVIFGGAFPTDMDSEDIQRIFSRLDLPWRAGSYCKSEAQLNRHHKIAFRNPNLKDAYYMKAVHLQGFHAESMLHQQFFKEFKTQSNFEPLGGGQWESAVLKQRIGKGSVGYIGDVGAEPESSDVLFAMLDLLTPPQSLEPDSSKFILILSGCGESVL